MLGADQNAMTEVALALAMAFFAIFVLAAVSMSQPAMQAKTQAPTDARIMQVNDIAISTSARQKTLVESEGKDEAGGARALAPDESFFALYQKRYYDKNLQQVPINEVQAASARGKVVLAVSPNLPMQRVLQIKQEKNFPNLSISLLNDDWISRLEAM